MKTIARKSMFNMIVVAVVAVLISMTFVGCGGSSPTEPTPLPTPTPNPTPNPTPTPQPGVITITVTSLNPPSGSTLVVGQRVGVSVRVSGVSSGNLVAYPSEDGVTALLADDSAVITGSGVVACSFTVQSPRKTIAVLFTYTPPGGQPTPIAGSTYQATYIWTSPTVVVSIGPGGVFSPRDSGAVANGSVLTYRNDDTVPHQPFSPGSSVVSCPGFFPGGVCTVTVRNYSGSPTRISVSDLQATDPLAEVHSFTVSP